MASLVASGSVYVHSPSPLAEIAMPYILIYAVTAAALQYSVSPPRSKPRSCPLSLTALDSAPAQVEPAPSAPAQVEPSSMPAAPCSARPRSKIGAALARPSHAT